ncbi:zinc ABC transporter ATP-binding protein ZnuC [Aquibaculum sediminis]|uniref:zinc ABC transporter ATP-binding protein ZnuC n=1 Tax=Aquibaculum sediminis TaxID=3231907 RepID=UPI003456716E
MSALISAEGICFKRGGRQILDNITLSVEPGEVVTLIGPNGSGKTSLLRILLGLEQADAGRVERRPGLTVGYVPQRLTVEPTLPITVLRFLSLPHRVSRTAAREALEETGVAHLERNQVHALSGGEFQRVLLARALLRRPDILVLDEPAQGIDFSGQLDLYQLIDRIRRRRGCSVLLVSHDLHLVMAATDRVICLNRHVCCSGEPEAVSRHPEYLALFGPRAAQALAIYHHHHDHHHDIAGEPVPLTGKAGRRTPQAGDASREDGQV